MTELRFNPAGHVATHLNAVTTPTPTVTQVFVDPRAKVRCMYEAFGNRFTAVPSDVQQVLSAKSPAEIQQVLEAQIVAVAGPAGDAEVKSFRRMCNVLNLYAPWLRNADTQAGVALAAAGVGVALLLPRWKRWGQYAALGGLGLAAFGFLRHQRRRSAGTSTHAA